MFSPFKTEAPALPAPTLPVEQERVPRPERLTKRPAEIERMDEYLLLAEELQIAALERGAVLQRAVADFIWENDIEMYDYSKVKTYMSALADKEKTIFCWRPLRDKDIPSKHQGSNSSWGWNHEENTHDYYWPSKWECRTYDKVVPFEVLKNVKLLDAKFPSKLHFFVTDYASSSPDPFIMVTARDMARIVFGVWDEPAFFKDA